MLEHREPSKAHSSARGLPAYRETEIDRRPSVPSTPVAYRGWQKMLPGVDSSEFQYLPGLVPSQDMETKLTFAPSQSCFRRPPEA